MRAKIPITFAALFAFLAGTLLVWWGFPYAGVVAASLSASTTLVLWSDPAVEPHALCAHLEITAAAEAQRHLGQQTAEMLAETALNLDAIKNTQTDAVQTLAVAFKGLKQLAGVQSMLVQGLLSADQAPDGSPWTVQFANTVGLTPGPLCGYRGQYVGGLNGSGR